MILFILLLSSSSLLAQTKSTTTTTTTTNTISTTSHTSKTSTKTSTTTSHTTFTSITTSHTSTTTRIRTTTVTTPPTTKAPVNPKDGILITGGYGSSVSVEVFNPHNNKSCNLTNLPNIRYGHTLCGGLLCGGDYYSLSCLLWNKANRTFEPTEVRLQRGRTHHLCWNVPNNNGVVLIGGTGDSSKTSELVVSDGSSSVPTFELQYPATYSCGIDLADQHRFVIIGGKGAMRKVSLYVEFMWKENLVELNSGRYQHACSMFTNINGNKVFLVNGGRNQHDVLLSSTELFEFTNNGKKGSWIELNQGNLQTGILSHKILTINNFVYLFGGKSDEPDKTWAAIWLMNTTRTEVSPWIKVGSMKKARYDHAVEILKDVQSICP